MKYHLDGASRNLSLVTNEFKGFFTDQWHNVKRLIAALSQVFHILVAFISTTFKTLPRTMTYCVVFYLAYLLVSWAARSIG